MVVKRRKGTIIKFPTITVQVPGKVEKGRPMVLSVAIEPNFLQTNLL